MPTQLIFLAQNVLFITPVGSIKRSGSTNFVVRFVVGFTLFPVIALKYISHKNHAFKRHCNRGLMVVGEHVPLCLRSKLFRIRTPNFSESSFWVAAWAFLVLCYTRPRVNVNYFYRLWKAKVIFTGNLESVH